MNSTDWKPVLVGSKAVAYHLSGSGLSPSDLDLMVTVEQAQDIISRSTKHEGGIVWFGETKVDLLTEKKDNKSNTNRILLELCNQYFSDQTMELSPVCESVIVPPLEILYTIYKSHIHRIIPYTDYQFNNIEIWDKHVKTYELIRQKLGYQKMDQIIYGGYGEYLDPLPEEQRQGEDILSYLTRKIFLARFEDTNHRVGDTRLSMEKSEEDFFNDNVKRYIDHDELHGLVGKLCRGDPKPLFIKYQKNDGKVDLDRETFIQATLKEQIQMMLEEIMVLLLERKWIPEMVKCFKEKNLMYTGYNLEKKKNELVEIRAHFITNLCGQGHYFLRRFCLDHYKMLTNPNIYDFDGLERIALQVADIQKTVQTATTVDILDQIKRDDGTVAKLFRKANIGPMKVDYDGDEYRFSKGENLNFGGNDLTDQAFIFPNENRLVTTVLAGKEQTGATLPTVVSQKIQENDTKTHVEDQYKSILKFNCVSHQKKTKHTFRIKKNYIRLVMQFFDLFASDDKVLLIDYKYNGAKTQLEFIIFNITKNVGIQYKKDSWNGHKWIIFTCVVNDGRSYHYYDSSADSSDKSDESYDDKGGQKEKEVEISGIYVEIDKDHRNRAGNRHYEKRVHVYYYSSEDSGCEWTDEYEVTEKYLSSYGNFNGPFTLMEDIFEKVARHKLGIPQDTYDREYL